MPFRLTKAAKIIYCRFDINETSSDKAAPKTYEGF